MILRAEARRLFRTQNQVCCGKCYNGAVNRNSRDAKRFILVDGNGGRLLEGRQGGVGSLRTGMTDFKRWETKVRTFQQKGTVRSRVEQKSFTERVLSKT